MIVLNRKQVLLGMGAVGLAGIIGVRAQAASGTSLTKLNAAWLIGEPEAMAWHKFKDDNGPALTGNPAWHKFLEFVEAKLKEYRCVDIHRSSWTFDRMVTTYWPDASQWSLVSDGKPVPLCNYGANCGLTGPEGVTAELVLWDPVAKPDVTGKIVVFRPTPRPDVRDAFIDADYEYMTPYDSWPVEGKAVPQGMDATDSVAPIVWDELTASASAVRDLAPLKPAGLVFAMNLNRAETEGLYTFPVPEQYNFPSVYVDRIRGDAVVADAKRQAKATIRVEGQHEQSEAYQLIAYLPGRDYGTDKDEQIQLRTHTDGPSISQDDGAFGLLGVIKYMAQIPQKDRPRTLMIELDCRHFMPGAERSWEAQDYFTKFPHARDKVVALVAMEHLGQIEYVADGDEIKPTGRSLETMIYSSGDQKMIDYAYKAAQDNSIKSAIIRSPGRPGAHGKSQGPWYGMGGGARFLGLPAFSMQGDLGAYWAFSARIGRFDPRSYCREVSLFCQLTAYLMEVDFHTIHVEKVDRAALTQGMPK